MLPHPTALLIGSTGFIGRLLLARLQAEGWTVIPWRADVRRVAECREEVEVVFHLAALTKHQDFSQRPHECYDVNIGGTLAVLNYCQRVGARCVFTSTSGVYDAVGVTGLLTETAHLEPTLPYGISKWVAENLCRQQAHLVPSVILRLFNVYGPGQHPDFFVPYVLDCLQEGRPLALRMPQARRDFVYVADVVEALVQAAHLAGTGSEVFNIGSGQATRVLDFVRLAEQIWGRAAVGLETVGANAGEVPAAIADIERARDRLGWMPRYDVQAGLAAMLKTR
jgi:nucleoside-diphosphate-sugar epimerase